MVHRFQGIYLLDSSTIVLPDELASVWQGCGGRTEPHTQAAIKLQVQLDLSTGALVGPLLQPGRAPDREGGAYSALPVGALRLADLGYFNLLVLGELGGAGVYWLSRLYLQTDECQLERRVDALIPAAGDCPLASPPSSVCCWCLTMLRAGGAPSSAPYDGRSPTTPGCCTQRMLAMDPLM